ncbi:hypothetical protein SGMN_38430 [Stenotrophomonas geniculata]
MNSRIQAVLFHGATTNNTKGILPYRRTGMGECMNRTEKDRNALLCGESADIQKARSGLGGILIYFNEVRLDCETMRGQPAL